MGGERARQAAGEAFAGAAGAGGAGEVAGNYIVRLEMKHRSQLVKLAKRRRRRAIAKYIDRVGAGRGTRCAASSCVARKYHVSWHGIKI